MNDYALLLAGVVCAAFGGELFLRGTVGIAHWARISPGIIGASVAAFATSSPELSVAVSSALARSPEISLGDALGSNVVNVALILGLALAVSGIQSPRDTLRRDFPVALGVPVVTGAVALDGQISRIDGVLMLCMFVAWLTATVLEARRQRSAAEQVLGARGGLAVFEATLGLALLVAAGTLVVAGARGIARSFGVEEFVIGATIVAIGTSAPELATTLVAKLRGHDELGLGTILGSNIFNGLLIVSVAALIHPITIAWRDVAVALLFGVIALAASYPARGGRIERRRGALLLLLYAGYLATILQRGAGTY